MPAPASVRTVKSFVPSPDRASPGARLLGDEGRRATTPSSMSAADVARRGASSGRRGAGRRSASRRAGPPQQRLAHRLGRARGRCRGTRARGARTRCGTRPTCPSRRAAAGRGGRRGAPDRGRRAGARRPARPRRVSIPRTASSCSSLDAGSAGLPPSRATAAATRSGCVAPIGSRSSATAPSTTWPGSASARARSRSIAGDLLLEARARPARRPRRTPPGHGEHEAAAERLRPGASRERASRARRPPRRRAATCARPAASGSARSAAGAGVTASSCPPSAANATTTGRSRPERASASSPRPCASSAASSVRSWPARSRGAWAPPASSKRGGQVVHRRRAYVEGVPLTAENLCVSPLDGRSMPTSLQRKWFRRYAPARITPNPRQGGGERGTQVCGANDSSESKRSSFSASPSANPAGGRKRGSSCPHAWPTAVCRSSALSYSPQRSRHPHCSQARSTHPPRRAPSAPRWPMTASRRRSSRCSTAFAPRRASPRCAPTTASTRRPTRTPAAWSPRASSRTTRRRARRATSASAASSRRVSSVRRSPGSPARRRPSRRSARSISG